MASNLTTSRVTSRSRRWGDWLLQSGECAPFLDHSSLQHPIRRLEDPLRRLLRNGITAQPELYVAPTVFQARQAQALTADHGNALGLDLPQRLLGIVVAVVEQDVGDLME